MFLSIDENSGFNPIERQEINNSFQAIEDRIDSAKVEEVDSTLKVEPITLKDEYNQNNWSVKIGDHQVSLLFKVSPKEGETIDTSYSNFKDTYCVKEDTDGLCYIKQGYILSKNDKQVRAIDAEIPTIYYTDNTSENVGVNFSFKKENYTVGRVKYPPLSKLSVKLASPENDLSTIYYGEVRTDGNIEIMHSHSQELIFQLLYTIP